MDIKKVTSAGQVTIPKHIREKLDIECGDLVAFIEENGIVRIENVSEALRKVEENTDDPNVARLVKYFNYINNK